MNTCGTEKQNSVKESGDEKSSMFFSFILLNNQEHWNPNLAKAQQKLQQKNESPMVKVEVKV